MKAIYEKGDRVQWPNVTQEAAADGGCYLTVKAAQSTRYASGKVYTKYLYEDLTERIIESMHDNIGASYDNFIAITGGEGVGKSNLGYAICKGFDPDFDMEKSLVYDWDIMLESMTEDPQKVYWMDEGVYMASSRDWMKETNKNLMTILQTMRSLGFTFVTCAPSFGLFDVYIRQHRTRYLLIAQEMSWEGATKSRGYYDLRIPDKHTWDSAPSDAPPEDRLKSLGFGTFARMDAEARETYERIKAKSQRQTLKAMLEKRRGGESAYRRDKNALSSLISYMSDQQGMSYKDIAAIAGMPYDTVKGIAWRKRKEEEDG